jgi:fumarate hydratase class II
MTDGCTNFRTFLVEGAEPNHKQIDAFLQRSLMLVTALNGKLGYDACAKIAKTAHKNGTTLREEAVGGGYLTDAEFDEAVRPEKMISPG